MGYKYPEGATEVDSIIADVVATVAWIDFILQVKLAHAKYPIALNSKVSENSDKYKQFQDYCFKVVGELTYREKIDEFFKVMTFDDKQYRQGMKTLMIELGKIRNKVAHNAAVSLTNNRLNLEADTVGAHMINTNYKLFNDIFKRVGPFVNKIEDSL